MKAIVLAATAVLLGLPACASSTQRPTSDDGAPADGAPLVVKLLDAGASPRVPLRLTPAIGPNGAVTLTLNVRFHLAIGDTSVRDRDVPAWTPLPPMILGLVTNVTKVSDSGACEFRFEVDSATLGPNPQASPDDEDFEILRARMGEAVGFGGDRAVDGRGGETTTHFDVSAEAWSDAGQALEALQQSIAELWVPFPVEAVGVGAQWEVRTQSRRNGIASVKVSKLRLESVEGNIIKLSVHSTQIALPQRIGDSNMTGGTPTRLLALTGSGDGTITWDLTQVMPNQAAANLTMKMKTEAQAEGTTLTMTMGTGLNIDIKPRPSLAP